MTAKRALVVGAGYVGAGVAQQLSAKGWATWALTRTREFASPISTLHVDVRDGAALRDTLAQADLLGGVDAVVYAVSADERSDEAYHGAYVLGLDNVLASIAGVARLIHVSSTGVYGQKDGEEVTEASPVQPVHFSGQRLLEAEELARNAAQSSAIVRLGGIYGPGRTRLPDMVRAGRAFVRRDAARFQNRIHRDDAAGFITHLLTMSELPMPVYIGVDDEPADMREVQAWFCDQWSINVGALQEPTGEARPAGKRCKNSLMKSSGYVLRYPTYREGYAELLRA